MPGGWIGEQMVGLAGIIERKRDFVSAIRPSIGFIAAGR
jgi:hypothetical protein